MWIQFKNVVETLAIVGRSAIPQTFVVCLTEEGEPWIKEES